MARTELVDPILSLELPREFEDLHGLFEADLSAIVSMVTQRAHERLWLTDREFDHLHRRLWTELAEVLSRNLEPLSSQWR